MKEELMRELMSFGLEKSIVQEIMAKYYHDELETIIGFLNNYGEFLNKD